MSTSLLLPAKTNMCQSCPQWITATSVLCLHHATSVHIMSGTGSSPLKYISPNHSHDRTCWIYLTRTLRGTCSHERSHTTITTNNFNLKGNQACICLVCLVFYISMEWRPFTNQFTCWFRALRALQCNPTSWKKKQNYIPVHMDGSL